MQTPDPRKILVLGAAGMLGHAVFRFLARQDRLAVYGAVRQAARDHQPLADASGILVPHWDAENPDATIRIFNEIRPHVVVNCVGLIKQLHEANDPLRAIPLNSLFPHRLAAIAAEHDSRLIHVSTDCVFAGHRGLYTEDDPPDATDLYGRTKILGEVTQPPGITLRTSIIGHELSSRRGLVDWFLGQEGPVKGFRRAVFSGLPTIEFARILHDHVLPRPELQGLYHVAARPIDKYALLKLISEVYGKDVDLVPDDALVIDRSLDATRFNQATGYQPPEWRDLVQRMHDFR